MSAGSTGRRIAVVIPARNEAQLLPRCLAMLRQAADQLLDQRPTWAVDVVVVLDTCTDDSARVVLAHRDVRSVVSHARCAGGARAAGCASVLTGPEPADWIACTDADSMVPPTWLLLQAQAMLSGQHLVLGTVRPDPTELTEVQLRLWQAQHRLEEGHSHVHGANMGISATAYRAVGGFSALSVHEDRELAAKVQRQGFACWATDAAPVLTSARRHGRVRGGFSEFLRDRVLESPTPLPPDVQPAG